MKILTLAGKVDTRALAYPLARALSLMGLTAVVTDDGAYRRLYKGQELKGNVSGVDISVGLKMDSDLKNSLNKSGIAYDYMLVVSSNYIPEDTDAVILCHGIDDSMMQVFEEEKPVVEEKESPKKKGKKGKTEEVSEEQSDEFELSLEKDESESKVEETIEKDVDDTFEFDESKPYEDIYISYNKPLDKYAKGLLLKDGLMQYIYNCEEKKQLLPFEDKNVCKQYATMVAKILEMDANELALFFGRQEYVNSKKVK